VIPTQASRRAIVIHTGTPDARCRPFDLSCWKSAFLSPQKPRRASPLTQRRFPHSSTPIPGPGPSPELHYRVRPSRMAATETQTQTRDSTLQSPHVESQGPFCRVFIERDACYCLPAAMFDNTGSEARDHCGMISEYSLAGS